MAKLLKLRRGTTTQHGSFTGAEGEVTIDTTKDTAVVHDGSTAGGRPLARQDMNNVPAGTIMGTQLENSGVTAGQYGSSSAIPIVTVDAQGLVTAASTTAIDSTTIANGTSNVAVANNGNITATRSGTARLVVDNAGVDVTGTLTATGDVTGGNTLTLSGIAPNITFTESNGDPDFKIQGNAGKLRFTDTTNNVERMTINTDGHVDIDGNLDVGAGIDVTGNITATGDATINGGDVTISGAGQPSLHLTDTSDNPDWSVQNNDGQFRVLDATNGTARFVISTGGNATFYGDVSTTGNITVTGTVDGVDVATRDTLFGGLTSSSGVLSNGVTATTQAASDNSTKVATTAYVTTGIANAQAFPSGTKMLFQQTNAPTGWTKVTSGVNNKSLRVVSGTVGSGGNVAFTTAFGSRGITANAANTTQGGNVSVANTTAGGNVSISSVSTSGTVSSHTLSSNEMPSHYHNINGNKNANYWGHQNGSGGVHSLDGRSYRNSGQQYTLSSGNQGRTENTGGGGGHSHGFTGSSHNHTGTLSGTAHTHNASFTGSAHNHSISVTNLDMQVEYLDVIIASKD